MSDGKFEAKSKAQTFEVTANLLSAIENGDGVSQRSLAANLGVALGLTNTLIKRCVSKGIIKVSEAPAKRFAYYLTPKGFKEKSKLVSQYLAASLSFFRRARDEYNQVFEYSKKTSHNKVALFGVGELAEIAVLSANEAGITLSAIISPGSNLETFLGIKVIGSIGEASDFDAVVISASNDPQGAYEELASIIDPNKILAPRLLHISRIKNKNISAGGDDD